MAGTVPGVVLGALVRVFLVPDAGLFQVLVAWLLAPLGAWLVWRSARPGRTRPTGDGFPDPFLVGLGLAAGLVGGIYGIGGGSLIAPILVGAGFLVTQVAPAALVSTFVTSCAGAASYVAIAVSGVPAAGPIWWIGVACGLGGLLGGYLGARLQERLPQRALTGILGLLAVAVAGAYLGRAFLS